MSTEEPNGTSSPSSEPVGNESDEDTSEAQAQVIASLRAQVTDLFLQVTQLNNKLVSSYDRVSDLEDQLHDTSSSLRNASLTISSLELERSHHLAALNTGLLVEKAHVTTELNRLMERATEEAAQRGQAESARHDIEKELDDLSASLFHQANTMVAEARLNHAKCERKVVEAEQALKIAEDAVKDMQVQMQVLHAEKEAADRDAQEAKLTMGKGKWVEHYDPRVGDVPKIRFTIAHAPYAEFIAFVTHLRGLRTSQPTPPAILTLLTQPFIARLITEDSEPTVRLDLAPSLNWLSRRSVLTAIHSGMLTVEPLSFSSLIQEVHQHPQSTSNSSLSCALCGTLIARLPSSSPVSRTHQTNGSSWFKYPLALSSTQNLNAGKRQPVQCEPPGQVYIFRVTAAATSTPPVALTPVHTSSSSVSGVTTSSRPPLNTISSSRVVPTQAQNSPYPLCTSNYCMTRLRSTCSLWAFVRVGIVERIWEEVVVQPARPLVNGDTKDTASPMTAISAANQSGSGLSLPSAPEKPPVPPRRRRLWDMASALGERAVGWGKEGGESIKEKEKETEKDSAKRLPIPPPSHPSNPRPQAEKPTPWVDIQDPPPLPKRNVVRDSPTSDQAVPPADTQNGTATSEAGDSIVDLNGHIDPDKADNNTSGFSTPPDEITFAAPLPDAPHPPSTMPHTAAESPRTKDELLPHSPHTVPLPMTPTTPNPTSRVATPVPRPRSQPSSPSPPPTSSRPASPALGRSRVGSPAPQRVTRTASPSPGQPPSIAHIRGKTSVSSPLASSRPASPAPVTGPGAPPLPRRAAARRAVPPPPTPGRPKVSRVVGEEEAMPSVATAANPIPEADVHKAGEIEIPTETKNHDTEGGDVVKEATASKDASVPTETTVTPSESAKDATVADVGMPHGDVEEAVNGTSATVHLDASPPPASESDRRTSMDTTSTKQSLGTEGEVFASDATWEERTWKELARLKEDMFWARMGGIRASQR